MWHPLPALSFLILYKISHSVLAKENRKQDWVVNKGWGLRIFPCHCRQDRPCSLLRMDQLRDLTM